MKRIVLIALLGLFAAGTFAGCGAYKSSQSCHANRTDNHIR